MKLNPKQISHLRGLAHNISPVVMIGNQGLTENILKEIEEYKEILNYFENDVPA